MIIIIIIMHWTVGYQWWANLKSSTTKIAISAPESQRLDPSLEPQISNPSLEISDQISDHDRVDIITVLQARRPNDT